MSKPSAALENKAIVLNSELKELALFSSFYYLPDGAEKLPTEQVMQSYFSQRSEETTGAGNNGPWFDDVENYTLSVFEKKLQWFAFDLVNPSDSGVEMILEVAAPNITEFRVLINQNQKLQQSFVLGKKFPFEQRLINNRYFLIPFDLAAGESLSIFLGTDNIARIMLLRSRLWQKQYYMHQEAQRNRTVFFLYGAMTILAILLAFAFVTTRERSYFYLTLAMICYGLRDMSIQGLAYQLLWPQWTALNLIADTLLMYGFNSGLLLFFVEYLDIKGRSIFVYRLVLGFVGLMLFDGALILVYGLTPLTNLVALLTTMQPTLVWLYCLGLAVLGDRLARNFAVVWSFFISAAIMIYLSIFSSFFINLEFSQNIGRYGILFAFTAMFLMMFYKIGRLRASERRARALSRAKSDFLATMSHEIRTPMNGVLGMAELLADTHLDDTQQRYLKAISSSGSTLLTVVNDILDFSKIESGKMDIEHIDFDLEKNLDTCVDFFDFMSSEKNVDLYAYMEPNIRQYIIGDPTRLSQILMNLVGNALKFTESGHISVVVSEAICVNTSVKLLRFEVNDTGIGLSVSQQEKLFQDFGQVDASINRQFGGTGLGLAICKHLVELMQGEIGLDSEPGVGSTFWFTLPLVPAKAPELMDYAGSDSLEGYCLLIVSANKHCNAMLTALAMRLKLRVTSVGSTDAAIATMQQNLKSPFNVVIYDSQQLEFDGELIASHLRETDRQVKTKLLVIGTDKNIPLASTFVEMGVDGTLLKPITADRLGGKLRTLLGVSNQHQVSAEVNILPVQFNNMKVLVADDNQVNLSIISSMLKKLQINAILVNDGRQALECYQQSLGANQVAFDVIFMDCEMPNMDGYQSTKIIRKLEKKLKPNRPVEIIALSAHALQEYKDRALQIGMNQYLTKPISAERVKQALIRLA